MNPNNSICSDLTYNQIGNFHDVINYYLNTNNNMPPDFDWIAYRSLNPDLNHITNYKDAIKHYKNHGMRQQRSFRFSNSAEPKKTTSKEESISDIPVDFDWLAYRSLYPDLKHINSLQDAIKHYINHGKRQNRQYKFATKKINSEKLSIDPNRMDYSNLTPTQIKDLKDGAYTYLNRKSSVPDDFDWIAYRSLNPDLTQIKCYQDAVKHYKEHGFRESRTYKSKDKLADHINLPQSLSSKINNIDLPEDILADKTPPAIIDQQTIFIPTNQPPISTTNQPPISTTDRLQSIHSLSNESKKIESLPEDQSLVIPYDFNWLAYRSLNADLRHINSAQEAIRHYREHGKRQNRVYKFTQNKTTKYPDLTDQNNNKNENEIPSDFNWIVYRSIHPDLKYINNQQQAIKHYVEHGKREGRAYVQTGQTPSLKTTQQSSIKHSPLNVIELPAIINEPKNLNQPLVLTPQIPKILPILPQNKLPVLPMNIDLVSNMRNKSNPKIISNSRISAGFIPNIIHFVYGFKIQTEEFELFKYIAIKSAISVNKPDKVYFYYKHEPFGKWWDLIKPYLILELVEPPKQIYGNKVTHFAHQSDVVRLKMLNERGGIYLDIDTICLRPLTEFLKYDFVMGIQGNNYGLCNAIMMAKPNTEFGKQWHQAYQNFNPSDWDYHSVILPLKLSKAIPITILANDMWFYPLGDPIAKIMFTSDLNLAECRKIFKNSYCIHLWESWSLPKLKEISETSIIKYNSLYNIIGRKYVINKFSIVMVTCNSYQIVKQCIDSLTKILERSDVEEIIIFDNNSTENELLEYLKNLPNLNNKFKVTLYPENVGMLEAKIRLFEKSIGSLICSIDSKLNCFHSEFLDLIIEHFHDESIGLIVPNGSYFENNYPTNLKKEYQIVDKSIDMLTGPCHIFKNDLKYFQIKLDSNYGKSETSDFSLKIRNLGKNAIII